MIARACKRYFFKTFQDINQERKIGKVELLQ